MPAVGVIGGDVFNGLLPGHSTVVLQHSNGVLKDFVGMGKGEVDGGVHLWGVRLFYGLFDALGVVQDQHRDAALRRGDG